MSLLRFLKKCAHDPAAARATAKVVWRDYYGKLYWRLRPTTPLAYDLPTGGRLLLEPAHAFTGVFWPAVEHYEPDVRTFAWKLVKSASFVRTRTTPLNALAP